MSPKVTVYTTPSCNQCEMTKKVLNKNQIAYDLVDLSEDESALEFVRGLGYAAAPIVVAGDDHWSGFRLTKLNSLVEDLAEVAA